MKKIFLVLGIFLLLFGCTSPVQNSGNLQNTSSVDLDAVSKVQDSQGGNNMVVAELGDTVKVHYIGSLPDGEVFDASSDANFNALPGRDTLEFTVGTGVIEGFTQGVLGLKVGENRTVTIPPEKGYGAYDPENVREIPKKDLEAAGIIPEVGMEVFANEYPVVIKEVKDENVLLDFNHKLAGKTLIFKIKLMDLQKK
ncbi:MAG: peptidylprolyl isomerase [Candidatus Diapherotrites archaeon]|nr:peptidylprolyl isomerase [Candidatus Diapherotrites archaeon]